MADNFLYCASCGAHSALANPKRIQEGAIGAPASGIELMAVERQNQLELGFTPHLDKGRYNKGELVRAALRYAATGLMTSWAGPHWIQGALATMWPWMHSWWKPTNPIRDLQKAGALLAADIDRRFLLDAEQSFKETAPVGEDDSRFIQT